MIARIYAGLLASVNASDKVVGDLLSTKDARKLRKCIGDIRALDVVDDELSFCCTTRINPTMRAERHPRLKVS
jgi:hypothetical protein